MSVGFGFSVGDFINGLELVGTVIDALRETRKSRATFKSLVDELRALQSALLRVKQLGLDQALDAQQLALIQAASQCQQTIQRFWDKVQKYQPHLTNRGTSSSVRDGWFKLKWALCKKVDVNEFRAEIQGHRSSIEIMLLAVQMEATTLNGRQQQANHKTVVDAAQTLHLAVLAKLDDLATSGATAAQQHTNAMANLTATIIDANLRIFKMLHSVHTTVMSLPGQVMFAQPVVFTDVFNFRRPIHLDMVNSKAALLFIIKGHLTEQGCDPTAIDRNEYVIEEAGTFNRINLTDRLIFCLQPGQMVEMSMRVQGPVVKGISCPRCGKDHQGTTNCNITCLTCGTVFRRIHEPDASDMSTHRTRSSASERVGSHNPMKRKSEVVQGIDVSKYRRIQVVSVTLPRQRSCSRPASYWTVYDQYNFWELLRRFGPDFTAIAENIGTKTPVMVKNFYERKMTVTTDSAVKVGGVDVASLLDETHSLLRQVFTK